MIVGCLLFVKDLHHIFFAAQLIGKLPSSPSSPAGIILLARAVLTVMKIQ